MKKAKLFLLTPLVALPAFAFVACGKTWAANNR
ncbi:Uncharacterised protein [Mesomycoplasma neurolyticum]|uniref:Lipoprotein n=1 Tax=Mesomycoplasma neurolyticum TaxID=2120 RepID=A0A449A4C4_9BACT|nr:Uncharacterised protein [Mesomycoplasma neurolyticum]